jgi:multidrug transporter EmrE-like cation transporter
MSLRAFHIVFVTVSTLLFVFLAVWAFLFAVDRTPMITALGVISASGAALMPVYGVFFYRKVRNLVL